MAAKHKVTALVGPTTPRASSAERRAAQIAALSTQQSDLKREAAERRRERDRDEQALARSTPRTRRSRAR
ncbi:MAG TPA: hypothetical protein VGL78_15910 [Solirubrobacteraceae bacterium]|jgi:hypothetical protein